MADVAGVTSHEHGTTLKGISATAWDHPVASEGTTPCAASAVLITSGYGCFQVSRLGGSAMVFREIAATEVREVLRAWLSGMGLRKAAAQAEVDRNTAR